MSQESDSVGENRGDGDAEDFNMLQRQEPLQRPVQMVGPRSEADNGELSILVEEGSRGSLEFPACQVHPEDVLEVISKGLNLVHAPKGGLSDVGNPEAREDSLQLDKERLQVNDEHEGSKGVPLADREEDGEDR